MKNIKDNFSAQAETYRKFRPRYPKELLELILSHCKARKLAWDCGTGNGQVAVELAKRFEKVFATDISEQQLQHAAHLPSIQYSLQRAEKTSFENNSFDLITVAQALHWFDQVAFDREVQRVLKPGGVLAVWGYNLLQIDPETDQSITAFYQNKIGSYWDAERSHIENEYSNLSFNLNEIKTNCTFEIQTEWTLGELKGYLNSWSSVRHFIKKNGQNPVEMLISELSEFWPDEMVKKVYFPVFLRLFRK